MMFEAEGVRKLFTAGVFHEGADAAVMLQGRTNIPTIGGMECPRFAFGRFQVEEDFGAWWCHGHGVKRKRSFHCFEGRE